MMCHRVRKPWCRSDLPSRPTRRRSSRCGRLGAAGSFILVNADRESMTPVPQMGFPPPPYCPTRPAHSVLLRALPQVLEPMIRRFRGTGNTGWHRKSPSTPRAQVFGTTGALVPSLWPREAIVDDTRSVARSGAAGSRTRPNRGRAESKTALLLGQRPGTSVVSMKGRLAS